MGVSGVALLIHEQLFEDREVLDLRQRLGQAGHWMEVGGLYASRFAIPVPNETS